MSFPRLLAALVLLGTACNPQTPHGGDDPTPPDADVDAPTVDVPDVDTPPPVVPPGRAVEVVNGAGRLTASAGARTYTFDVVIGGAPRGRTGAGTRTLDAAPVLR